MTRTSRSSFLFTISSVREILPTLLMLCLMLGSGSAITTALSQTSAQVQSAPLSRFLNPDGSLNLRHGFKGSIDPRGFRMTHDLHGEPLFIAESKSGKRPARSRPLGVPVVGSWDSQFGFPGDGVEGLVDAIATNGAEIYLGGELYALKGNTVANVAEWNGSSWSGMGGGVNGAVSAIVVSGSDVYVGGFFTMAGGVPVHSLAMWDGSAWSDVGGGVEGSVYALAFDGSRLYVGGLFFKAGGTTASNIAMWDGTSWSTMAGGTDAFVAALATRPDTLYAGGGFTNAGGITVNSIARWDGSAWSSIGGGTASGNVNALALKGSVLYAGGAFSLIGGVGANSIAMWDGTGWSSLGAGLDNDVSALAVDGNAVYAVGSFVHAGGQIVDHIAVWTGGAWDDVGGGSDRYLGAVAVEQTAFGDTVWVGGSFTSIGNIKANNIARWDHTQYEKIVGQDDGPEKGTDGNIYALVSDGVNIFAGGYFTNAGNTPATNIAKWDGASWTDLGGVMSAGSFIQSLAIMHDTLYAGGRFTEIGGVNTNNIARWDGVHWLGLGSGVSGGDGLVYGMGFQGENLYACGPFTSAGGVPVNSVAMWNGAVWADVGGGVTSSGGEAYPQALFSIGGAVYVGGEFDHAGGQPAQYIAKWDGEFWSDVGGGTDGDVYAFAAAGGVLFAGGEFYHAGSATAQFLAQWDGSAWSPVGAGELNPVTAMAASGDSIYIGTSSENNGISPSLDLWDGTHLTTIGADVGGDIYSLVPTPEGLFMSGEFGQVSGIASANFARHTVPGLRVQPAGLAFGSAPVGNSVLDSIAVTNSGSGVLSINSIMSTNPAVFALAQSGALIQPHATKEVHVTFMPQSLGYVQGAIVFSSNAPASPESIVVSGTGVSFLTMTAYEGGWNLISAPVIGMPDDSIHHLFPAAEFGYAFAYAPSGYVQEQLAGQGRGYWEKFSAQATDTVSGTSVALDTIAVTAGWNLIGSISSPVSVATVGLMGTNVESQYYGYKAGYQVSDTIQPGRAYWVNVSANGNLILGGSGASFAKSASPAKLPVGMNTLVIADADGNAQTLYFGAKNNAASDVHKYLLPPKPPAGVFDARFSSQRMVEFSGTSSSNEFQITIASAEYPVTISWNIAAGDKERYALRDNVGGNRFSALLKNGGGSATVNDSRVAALTLSVAAVAVPKKFALEQNYPNPFNPTATIRYDLPVDSRVTLNVYDMLGREVATLVNEEQSADYREAVWNANGSASGIYFYRLFAVSVSNPGKSFTQIRKMVLMR